MMAMMKNPTLRILRVIKKNVIMTLYPIIMEILYVGLAI
jgi:hypothetical protein